MIAFLPKLIGIVGVLFISGGILHKKRSTEDVLYIIGGVFLTLYSIHIGDIVFIVLQLIFISSAVYDFVRIKRAEKKS